jgi:hypothetical protein
MWWSLGILLGLLVLHIRPSVPDYDTQQDASRPPITQSTPIAVEQQRPPEPPFSVVEGDAAYYGAMSSNVGVAVLALLRSRRSRLREPDDGCSTHRSRQATPCGTTEARSRWAE